MRIRSTLGGLLVVVGLLLPLQLDAGGALRIQETGEPYRWPNGGRSIPFHPDRGALGILSNFEAVNLTEEAFARWDAVAGSSASYFNAGPLPFNVDVTNFFSFFFPGAPDGLNAVVYDEDGSIFRQLFGNGSGILAFAGPEWLDSTTGEILEGVAFINGGFLIAGLPPSIELEAQVHEFGHFSNLAHTVVNGEIAAFGDQTGPSPFDSFPPESLEDRIETMYPFLIVGGGMGTPHADDRAILSTLYPAPGFFESSGAIRGTILAPDGETPLTGANVIARNVSDPFDDAVSAISGDFASTSASTDSLAGTFSLNGLTPGATYALYVDQVLAGDFSTRILFPLPGVEEFFNGASESNDPEIDDPAEYVGLTPVAGSSVEANIIFNALGPGPIPLGDDDFVELPLHFPFAFCGRQHESIFVNSNGSVSFDRGDVNFLESPSSFLSAEPRIAVLWDDLAPDQGGVVSFARTDDTFSVSWQNVPEFGSPGGNTFGITLRRASNQIDLVWGNLTATDGLAGYSCGGDITFGQEPPTDLSLLTPRTINGRNSAAIWESFPFDDGDLANSELSFTAPNQFQDPNEPNDIPTQATRVRIPFDSRDRFTELAFPGGDVDYYRFRAEGGTTIVAETRPGNIVDTVLGLFDLASGSLLATDIDSGFSVFSRIIYEIPHDGLYAVAVASFPDLDFSGQGRSVGRYILDIQTIEGTLLSLEDDGAIEIPFESFEFPFQGGLWSSVWLNSNGNLTFGESSPSFAEDVQDFLDGPPRIAALWDDLSPNNGGVVLLTRTTSSLTITFREVPEFIARGGNSFAITLQADGRVEIDYGPTNGSDALVGITPGRGASDPGPTDLSSELERPANGTTYELFTLIDGVDLDGTTLVFSDDRNQVRRDPTPR